MQANALLFVLRLISVAHCFLSYDPDDYLEVYPDPRDPEVLQGRTPLHFALIQSLGGPGSQLDGSGTLAGVKIALDGINNDASLLPGYTLHYTFTNSKCNRTVSLDALYSQIFHEPKKLAIIGSGCSVATEPTAEVSHYFNLTQISCVSSSVLLGNRVRFRGYFQLLATIERVATGYYGVIREFGWKRIAFIVQDENLWTVTVTRLKALLDQTDVEYNERVFNTSAGLAGLGPNPFDKDSRIFLLSMFSITALPFLCEAYHRGIRYPEYVVLTLGRFRRNWWRQEISGLTCTADQRESVMLSSLAFTESYFLNEVKDANVTATSGITGAEFFAEERKFIGKPPLNITQFQYSQYCHDATWTLAYALNKTLNSLNDSEVNDEITQAFNITPPFRLEDFTYNNHKLMEIMFQHLANTSFDGITGPVSFGDQGIRKLDTIIVFQFRERVNVTDGSTYLDLVDIGNVNGRFEFSYAAGEDINTLWQGGRIPYDGVAREERVTIHPALTGVYIALACAGIAFSIACLIFNFNYRNAKLIKMASTKLNYLIGIGAIVLYVDTFFFVIPSTDCDVVNVFCNLTPWLTSIGYSLCYGTILAKMARVYYIFNNPTANKKMIRDRFLILGVAALVGIDLTILVTYTLVEGIRGNLATLEVPHKEKFTKIEGEFGIITNNFICICNSNARDIFLGILYGYKMLLQIIALVLAFAIRKVKVKGLDDAKYIGVTIYVTSIVLAVTILATYSLKDVINGFAALFCTGFLVGTSVILFLVFVPQMVGLYRDPKGETIFGTSVTASHPTLGVTKDIGSRISENEVQGQRKRMRELEDKVKELMAIIKKHEEKRLSADDSCVQASRENGEKPLGKTIWDTPEEKDQQR